MRLKFSNIRTNLRYHIDKALGVTKTTIMNRANLGDNCDVHGVLINVSNSLAIANNSDA